VLLARTAPAKHAHQGVERRVHCRGREIFIEGKKADIKSPQDSKDRGLRFIYQELSLVPDLDIARNMFLGMEPMLAASLGVVDERSLYEQARKLLASFHIDLDPSETVRKLSVTQQKMVEIARALTTQAKAIILDEPTDVLEDQSRKALFEVIRKLKVEQGIASFTFPTVMPKYMSWATG